MRRRKPRGCGQPQLRRLRMLRLLRVPRRRLWLRLRRLLTRCPQRKLPRRPLGLPRRLRPRRKRLLLPPLRCRNRQRQRRFQRNLRYLLSRRSRQRPASFHRRQPRQAQRLPRRRARNPRQRRASAGRIHCLRRRRVQRHQQPLREPIQQPRGQPRVACRLCRAPVHPVLDLFLRGRRCAPARRDVRCPRGRDSALLAVGDLRRCCHRIEFRRKPNRASRYTSASPRRVRGRRSSGDLKKASANCIPCGRAPARPIGAPRRWSALRRRRRANRAR